MWCMVWMSTWNFNERDVETILSSLKAYQSNIMLNAQAIKIAAQATCRTINNNKDNVHMS